MLLEGFKKCVLTPIKTYPEEQKVNELQKAASLADNCKLRHKSSTAAELKFTKAGNNVDSALPDQKKISNPQFGPTCGYCKR